MHEGARVILCNLEQLVETRLIGGDVRDVEEGGTRGGRLEH
jgi:hypothetical protein